jgi:hypothetical protein
MIFQNSFPFPSDSKTSWKYALVVPLKKEKPIACVIDHKTNK